MRSKSSSKFLVFFLVAMLVMTLSFSLSAEERKKLSNAELWDIYYKFVAEVKPYGIPTDRKQHEEKLKPSIRIHDGFDDFAMVDGYARIRTSEAELSVRIDIHTGEIRRCFLRRGMEPGQVSDKSRFDEKPKMTEADALGKAKEYLWLNTQCKMESYETNAVYYCGEWTVYFHPKQGEYSCLDDFIAIGYDQEYGFSSYWNHLFSSECKDIEPRIAAQEAEKLSLKYLHEALEREGYTRKVNITDKYSTLGIVSPAYTELHDGLRKATLEECRRTRLAYVFRYDLWYDEERVVLHIDALTGELLYQGMGGPTY